MNQEGRITQRPKIKLKSRIGEFRAEKDKLGVKDQRIRYRGRNGATVQVCPGRRSKREFYGGSVITERLFVDVKRDFFFFFFLKKEDPESGLSSPLGIVLLDLLRMSSGLLNTRRSVCALLHRAAKAGVTEGWQHGCIDLLRIIKHSENPYYHLQLTITYLAFRLDRGVIMGGVAGEGRFHLGRCLYSLSGCGLCLDDQMNKNELVL